MGLFDSFIQEYQKDPQGPVMTTHVDSLLNQLEKNAARAAWNRALNAVASSLDNSIEKTHIESEIDKLRV